MKNSALLTLLGGVIFSAFSIIEGPLFSNQKVLATITDDRLKEASGLEESYVNPGYFWTHNDSDSEPSLYLIDREGKIHMEVRLKGIKNRDWEEVVTVQEEDKCWIYVAEIGDNKAVHKSVSLIRLEEPELNKGPFLKVEKEDLDIMSFKYAEGARDAEALFFDFHTQEMVLVTKREKNSMIYSFPFQKSSEPILVQSKGSIPDRNFTAADMNESGEILLKHYDAIYYWPASNQSAADRILSWKPIEIEYTSEPQGEAICWYNGDFYTISEKNRGKPQEMLVFERID